MVIHLKFISSYERCWISCLSGIRKRGNRIELNKHELIANFLEVHSASFSQEDLNQLLALVEQTPEQQLNHTFAKETRVIYSNQVEEAFLELTQEIIADNEDDQTLADNFRKRGQRLDDLCDALTEFMRNDLQMRRSDVREWLKEVHIESIRFGLRQYWPISQLVEEHQVTPELENVVTRLVIAVNQAIFINVDAMIDLKAFYDIPKIKSLVNTIFSSYVWYSKQRFKNVDRNLRLAFERQRKSFTMKTRELEKLYWNDFPERLEELQNKASQLQKKMKSIFTSKHKKQELYNVYQQIQNEINHPLFECQED